MKGIWKRMNTVPFLPVRNTHLTKSNFHIQDWLAAVIQEMPAHKYLKNTRGDTSTFQPGFYESLMILQVRWVCVCVFAVEYAFTVNNVNYEYRILPISC